MLCCQSIPVLSQIVPWQTMVPFIDGQNGARIVLENVVWNVFYGPSLELTAEDILADLLNRDRPDSNDQEQIAELRTDAFCSEFVQNSTKCLESRRCFQVSGVLLLLLLLLLLAAVDCIAPSQGRLSVPTPV